MRAPFQAHTGWVELLKRLPEAGLIPDDPELIGAADRHPGDLGARRSTPARTCSTTGRASTCRPAPEETASFPSGARRMCRRAAPTAATAAAAATSRIVVRPVAARPVRLPARRPLQGQARRARRGREPPRRDTRHARDTGAARHGRRGRGERRPLGDAERRASAPWWRAAAAAGAATGSSPPPPARPRASRSAGCPARSGRSSCSLRLKADAGLVGLPNAGKSLAARPPHARAAEGRRLPVHHDRARARHAGARRPPAGDRGHPRPDRGRERRRRARARVPRARRALPAARPRARPEAARRLGPERELRDGRGRAARARARPRPAAAPAGACPRPTWCRRRRREAAVERWRERLGVPRCSPPPPRPARGCEELSRRHLPARSAGGARRERERRDARGAPRLPARPRRVLQRRAHRAGRVPRGGRADRAADRPPRRGQRRGAPLRRGAPARARRDQGARVRRLRARRRRGDRAGSSSSSIPADTSQSVARSPYRSACWRCCSRAAAAVAATTRRRPSRPSATSSRP